MYESAGLDSQVGMLSRPVRAARSATAQSVARGSQRRPLRGHAAEARRLAHTWSLELSVPMLPIYSFTSIEAPRGGELGPRPTPPRPSPQGEGCESPSDTPYSTQP